MPRPYQEAVADALTKRTERALKRFDLKSFCCAGGVSMNKVLREKLTALSKKTGVPLLLCPPSLCTDNAAIFFCFLCMLCFFLVNIAGVAYEKIRLNKAVNEPNDVNPNLKLGDWTAG